MAIGLLHKVNFFEECFQVDLLFQRFHDFVIQFELKSLMCMLKFLEVVALLHYLIMVICLSLRVLFRSNLDLVKFILETV